MKIRDLLNMTREEFFSRLADNYEQLLHLHDAATSCHSPLDPADKEWGPVKEVCRVYGPKLYDLARIARHRVRLTAPSAPDSREIRASAPRVEAHRALSVLWSDILEAAPEAGAVRLPDSKTSVIFCSRELRERVLAMQLSLPGVEWDLGYPVPGDGDLGTIPDAESPYWVCAAFADSAEAREGLHNLYNELLRKEQEEITFTAEVIG